VEQPTGIGPAIADEYHVDPPVLEVFVGALVRYFEQSNHPTMRSLMDGFTATSLVLLERGTGTVLPLVDTQLIGLRATARRTMVI